MATGNEEILVVEDNVHSNRLVCLILSRAGYKPVSTLSAEEAWENLEKNSNICAVVLDLQLPGMNGLDLLKKIRNTDMVSHLPVILVTSLGKPEDIAKGHKLGANHYMIKPIHGDVLIGMIHQSRQDATKIRAAYLASEKLKDRSELLENYLVTLSQINESNPFSLLTNLKQIMSNALGIIGEPSVRLLEQNEDKLEGITQVGEEFEICYPPYLALLNNDSTIDQRTNCLELLALMSKHVETRFLRQQKESAERNLKNVISSSATGSLQLLKEMDETGDAMKKELVMQKIKINLMEVLVAAGHDEMQEDLNRLRAGAMSDEEQATSQASIDDLLNSFGA